MSARKYVKGALFTDAASFAAWIAEGGHVYWHDKFQHNGWAQGWQVRMALEAVRHGTLSRAVPREVVK